MRRRVVIALVAAQVLWPFGMASPTVAAAQGRVLRRACADPACVPSRSRQLRNVQPRSGYVTPSQGPPQNAPIDSSFNRCGACGGGGGG